MHRDDLSGLTYRELMAKLIALEDGAEVICDSLELRKFFWFDGRGKRVRSH